MHEKLQICYLDEDSASTEQGEKQVEESPVSSQTQFEMIEKAPDSHAYIRGVFEENKVGNRFMKAIQLEHKILRTSLPESIFVKSYENRIDLVSALIIGPMGTPFAYGFFLFDICLPVNYPQDPPQVFYR